MKFDLKLNKKTEVSKYYDVKNFKPEKFFTHQFVVGEDNVASRIICTAYLTKFEISTYNFERVIINGEFKYVFDNTGDDVVTKPFVHVEYSSKDFHFEGVFSKKLYCNDIELKRILEYQVVNNYCVINNHERAKYDAQFGKVPYISNYCLLHNVVSAVTYDHKLDLITVVELAPVSVSSYMTYYHNKIDSNTAKYSEEDLAVYYDYIKKCIAAKASASKELTDYTPSVSVPSFEYFMYQRKIAKKYVDDFEKVKELSYQLKPYLTAEVKEYFIADLYRLTERTTDSPKPESTKSTSKKSKKTKKDDNANSSKD